MLRKVRIEDDGTTRMLPGSVVDINEFEEENRKVIAEGGTPATGKRVLMSITKAALATDSFLSAASFMETTKVLTDAAVKGSVDNLAGLKENIIMGKLIPAGTGISYYQDIDIDMNLKNNDDMIFDDDISADEETDDIDDVDADEFEAVISTNDSSESDEADSVADDDKE